MLNGVCFILDKDELESRCTSEIMSDNDYWKYFAKEKGEILEIRLCLFNPDQRRELFEKFNVKNPLPESWTIDKLENFIR